MTTTGSPDDTAPRPLPALPGLAVCVALAAVATALATLAPVVGAPVLAIALGVVVRQVAGDRASWRPGVRFASKKVLQGAVVLLGAGLSLAAVARTGLATLPVMVGTVAVALVAGRFLGRALRIDDELRTLITCGTAICGASAIAAVSAAIGASEAAVAYSVTVIFVYNVLAAVLLPALGHLLGMSQDAFGVWAGTAVNDTSSVVAAGTTYGVVAAQTAVVVKLARTLLVVPVTLVEGAAHRRRTADTRAATPWWRLVPTFLLLFLLAAAANSLGLVPARWHDGVHTAALLATTTAMAGIGLSTPLDAVRRAGWRPLALGGALSVLVAVSSLGLQAVSGTL